MYMSLIASIYRLLNTPLSKRDKPFVSIQLQFASHVNNDCL